MAGTVRPPRPKRLTERERAQRREEAHRLLDAIVGQCQETGDWEPWNILLYVLCLAGAAQRLQKQGYHAELRGWHWQTRIVIDRKKTGRVIPGCADCYQPFALTVPFLVCQRCKLLVCSSCILRTRNPDNLSLQMVCAGCIVPGEWIETIGTLQ